jgi:N-acetylmuramoyl-L-alanine amidase
MRSTFAAASGLAATLALAACGGSTTKTETVMVPPRPASGGTSSAAPPAAAGQGGCTRIVIDPGHDSRANPATEPIGPGSAQRKIRDGGGASGAVTHTPESLVNLQVSLKLRRLLLADGYCVTMTRARQTGLSMGNVERAQIANRAHAALFVRIHADGSTDASRSGTSVLYPALHRGWTDDILPASKVAAQKIQTALVRSLGSRDLGIVARSDLTGFNWADVPSVLPELGFLSNAREDRLLSSPAYQDRAARGLESGIRAFVPPHK